MSEKKRAVALEYNPDDAAPKVVAKGAGLIAEKILERAGESDVPVYEDAELVKSLDRLDLGANIPKELYEVVARVLVFIDWLDRREAAGR